MLWLVALFVVLPLAELWLIVQVAGQIGALETLLTMIAITVVGGWLVKREGLGVWARLRSQLERGLLPPTEVIDGFLLLVAGVLLLVPGFLTDVVAALVLIPPTRALFRRLVLRWVRRRRVTGRLVVMSNGRAWVGGRDGRDVIDVESEAATVVSRPAGELGRP
jgi:UPF0716 protein FxsA